MRQFFKDITFSVFWTMIILAIVGCIAACSNKIECENDNPIIINWGKEFNESKRNIIIIKDIRRNLQWDAFSYDKAIVIIPGTERPIKNTP